MTKLRAAPDQILEYVAIEDNKVVETVEIDTNTTDFPALLAAKKLAPAINRGAVMYLRCGTGIPKELQ